MNKKISLIIILFFILLGCGEKYVITTQIFPDGTCIRELTVTSDKDNFDSSRFPITINSSWIITRKVDSLDSIPHYIYIAKKKYDNVNLINNEFIGNNNYSVVNRKIVFKKYFRWFYSLYKYEEKYEKLFHQYPMDSFLVEDELQILHSNKPDTLNYFKEMDSVLMKKNYELIEEKYWHWVNSSLFEEYFVAFVSFINKGNDSIYTKDLLENKDSIFNKWSEKEYKIDTIIILADSIIGASGAFNKYYYNKDSIIIEIEKKIKFYQSVVLDDNIENKIIMPGKIIKTNADITQGDTATFNIHWEKYFSSDYTMEVISKRNNSWASYFSIIILALFIIIFNRKKKEK